MTLLTRALALAVVAVLLPVLGAGTAASAESYQMLVSATPDRSAPVPLAGTTQSGPIYVFTDTGTGVSRVRFYLDDPDMVGAPRQVEKGAPHDFAGTAKNGEALPFRTGNVTAGPHVITAAVDRTDGTTTVLSAQFTVEHAVTEVQQHNLVVSTQADRGSPQNLAGSSLTGKVYIFTTPDTDVARVRFHLDDPSMSGDPFRTERSAPFDFNGTAGDGTALPFDLAKLAAGEHSVTAALIHRDGTDSSISASFTVASGSTSPALTADKSDVSITAVQDGSAESGSVVLGSTDGQGVDYTSRTSASWLTVAPATGSVPATVDLVATPGTLAAGQYTADATFSASGYASVAVRVTLTVRSSSTGAFDIVWSSSSSRSNPQSLAGSSLTGKVYIFTTPDTDVARVRFYLDDPTMSQDPFRSERSAPFDFNGSAGDGTALPFDLAQLAAGEHSVTAALVHQDGSESSISASFTVGSGSTSPAVTADKSDVSITATEGGSAGRAALTLGTTDGTGVDYTSQSSASWLSVAPATGRTPAAVDVVATPGTLAPGQYTADVTFSATGYESVAVSVTFTVRSSSTGAFDIVWSAGSSRSNPQSLDGQTVSGSIYVFSLPDTGVESVEWWLDDASMSGTPWRVDAAAPYDFMPGSKATAPVAFETGSVPDGSHNITARVVDTAGAAHVVSAGFLTDNDTNSLTWTPGDQTIQVDPGTAAPVTFTAQLTADVPGTVATLAGGEPYLSTEPADQVTTPATVEVTVNPEGLTQGTYTFKLEASAAGTFTGVLTVQVNVGDSQGCVPVACELVRVDQPYVLPFDSDQGLLMDRNGVGTGFTMLLPDDGGEYVRQDITLDAGGSALRIAAGPGSFKTTENAQVNAVGVGFNGGAINVLTTTLTALPAMSGHYEQAGLWFGFDQDNVMKLNLVSTPNGPRVEQVLEVDGVVTSSKQGPILSLTSSDNLVLTVKADPVTRKVTGAFRVNTGGSVNIAAMDVPGAFFSADAAGIDPRIGTRTFGGIFTSKRKASGDRVFSFADFSLTGQAVTVTGALEFTRSSHAVSFPTSMAFGPDGKLYVATLQGTLHVLTYDSSGAVITDQQVTTLGQRLALGIAIDPSSTADNVVVWVAHSSPSLSSGEADSGMVTRLSGPSLGSRQDVITGLPRSIANHGPNSLHFAPDGRLLIAVGGNTGAGAANTADTEFGDRAEQPLSAAIVAADVRAAGFDGSCADPADIYSSDDCDVSVYASGLRNTYDFTFHSNGKMYGPDNGLGVVGSYPPTPTPPCHGFGSTTSYKNGGNNPGEQPDELNLIVEGRYYGHPNPTREECVFGDGSYQNVAPLATYTPPMHDLGRSRSANGIIEYTGDAYCGSLRGSLLVTNYSVGDDIVALRLSADGTSVLQTTSLVSGLGDPLPLVQAPDGSLVVGEFGAGKITRLRPLDSGCWNTSTPMPVALLDAGGTAIGDDIYVVGGKTPDGPQSTVHRYNVSTDSWDTAASLPLPAVENPATVAVNGVLYAFGGSSGPFSGASGRSAAYDPAQDRWTLLPDMPTARGGAVALHLPGKIYVIGGMTGDGASSATVEIFDLASRTWSTGPGMATPRDNPGGAAIDGRLYVFGGRTRLASGSTVNGALSSVESFDPATGTWSSRAPMPTGRRTMGTAVVDGRAILIGGEGGSDGNAFSATESYDPATDSWTQLWPMTTPRHGAVTATVNGLVHVLGGGPKTGSDWTTKHEVFRPPAWPAG